MDKTLQTRTPGVPDNRKKTAQRNHETFVIPPSLEQYADEPLYILIALWCRQQNTWVGRADITESFALNERRASFQISYISRRNTRVTCEVRAVRDEGSSCPRHEIRVTGVVLSRDVARTVPAQPKSRPLKRSRVGNATPELRNLFNSLIGSRKTCEN